MPSIDNPSKRRIEPHWEPQRGGPDIDVNSIGEERQHPGGAMKQAEDPIPKTYGGEYPAPPDVDEEFPSGEEPEEERAEQAHLEIEIQNMIQAVRTSRDNEYIGARGMADMVPRATAEIKGLLASRHEPREVDVRDLEQSMRVFFKIIEKAKPGSIEKIASAILRDPESLKSLRELIADADKFGNVADEVAEKLATDEHRSQSRVWLLVLAGACLLAGGVATPLWAGAKGELIYTNALAGTSAMCAAGSMLKDRGRKP